jgi:hypothetical protein
MYVYETSSALATLSCLMVLTGIAQDEGIIGRFI